MTKELFRDDSYLRACDAVVTTVNANVVCTDKTVFYPLGGGQPGDTGTLRWDSGSAKIVDTRYADGAIGHILEDGAESPEPGTPVRLEIDWERRYRHMRMHTAMHLLGSVLRYGVTGGNSCRWISEEELDANPDLVRTMSVQPPRGKGSIRLLEIEGVDLQPCGGTHVKSTAEVGAVRIGKVEKKGRQNRRVNIHLDD